MNASHNCATSDIVGIIHDGTAIYTAQTEIRTLLSSIDWPHLPGNLLDPGCGDGNMVVEALRALTPAPGDWRAVERVKGMDFHGPSVDAARERVAELLVGLGWQLDIARRAASTVVEQRDYLLDPPHGKWEVMLANPPYWRRKNLPASYRDLLDQAVPRHACGDLLHAYLHRMAGNLADGGTMALVTSDRWLLNSGAAALREEVGAGLRVQSVRRLDTRSAFHRPKERSKGTPPRVHAVAMVMGTQGREMTASPFRIEELPHIDGILFKDLAELRLAPWLGADNIFMVPEDSGLPQDCLIPCVEPGDLCPSTDHIGPTRRWAILTNEQEPPAAILEHLDRNLHRMPPRGLRRIRWLPPERFDGRLPLAHDAVLIPRLATRLRAVRLPAGHLPTNHSLVVASGLPVEILQRMLTDPRVQRQADALALRVEDGYRSYTATLLRQLVIPHDLIENERMAA